MMHHVNQLDRIRQIGLFKLTDKETYKRFNYGVWGEPADSTSHFRNQRISEWLK